jgi:hypothetical protein
MCPVYRVFALRLERLKKAGTPLDLSGHICDLVADANPSGSSMKTYVVNGWTKAGYDGILFVRCEKEPVSDEKRGFVWTESSEEEIQAYVKTLDTL